MPTYAFDITVKFEAKDKEHAQKRADRICKLLETGSPAAALRELDVEARFAEVKNLRDSED